MATATFGRMDEFQTGQDWPEYIERLEFYLAANEIGSDTEEDQLKRKSVLLTVCGAKTYSLIRNLCMPQTPKDKTYEELKALVTKHLTPMPQKSVERFKFWHRVQTDGETISEFLAEPKKMTEHCQFGPFLDEALKDRFVCGLKSTTITKKLLAEDPTLQKAVDIALSMEAAEKQAQELRPAAENKPVQKLKQQQWECFRCGKKGHVPDKCFYKDSKCHKCHQKGHLSRKCKQKAANTGKPEDKESESTQRSAHHKMKKKASKVKHLQAEDDDNDSAHSSEEDEIDIQHWSLYTLRSSGHKEINIQLQIEKQPVTMELDTGSYCSVVSDHLYRRCLAHIPLEETQMVLTTYTGDTVPVLGEIRVRVDYEGQVKTLPLIVCKGHAPALLGRNWLFELKLNWKKLKHLQNGQKPIRQQNQAKYPSLFDGGLGKVKGVTASLKVKKNAPSSSNRVR